MNLNLLELWSEMGLPVRCVVIMLTMQAVLSIAVVIDRLLMLMRSRAASKEFVTKVRADLDQGRMERALEGASQAAGSHLAMVFHVGLTTFLDRRDAGDGQERAAELARRAMERRQESTGDELQRGMGVLASTGSTAPFVGLLGTVLGIINAFQLIASNGSGGIGTIGAAIGEALIVTGYGLTVAIPTVLLYNSLSTRLGHYEMAIQHGASELADRLETSGPTRSSGDVRKDAAKLSLETAVA